MTLTAQWTDNKNTLKVDPNGGSVTFDNGTRSSSHSVTKKHGETIKVPNATRSQSVAGDGRYTVTYDVGECSDSTP